MSDPSCTLGAFSLGAELARGGMAVVHRGVHRSTGTPVAIKVVTRAASASHVRAIRREVRRVAQLDHPSIIRIHDQGELPEGAAAFGLEPGMPWFAMDYLGRGSLETHPPVSWEALRGEIGQLLEALAHAHARGIVHRDLKPGNALRSEQGRVVLTDFGIATQRSEGDRRVIGTPYLMAPEQILGQFELVGPWTDLYALGCTAWWFATGRPPRAGLDVEAIFAAHLDDDLPSFQPRFAVPPALESWLRALMEREPGARFQRAADALVVLEGLAEADGPGLPAAPEASAATHSLGTAETWMADELARPKPLGAAAYRPPPEAPPRQPKMPLLGPRGFADAGLGLAGFRRPPLVGRDAAWSRLCEALERVRETNTSRVTQLHGASGVGATWLARCFVEGAEEVGAATGLFCPHSEPPAPEDGVAPALLSLLGCRDPDRGSTFGRLMRWALARDPEAVPGQLEGLLEEAVPAARRASVWRLLELVAVERPVVVVVDDLQHGSETRALIEHALGRPAPVLWLATSDAPRLEGPQADALELPALDRPHTRQLLDALLDLSGAALERLADLSDGRPGVAVALIRELSARGKLVSTPTGAGLLGPVDLPEDLAQLGLAAVDSAERDPRDREAIELAAVLGPWVPHEAWSRATGRPPDQDRALAERLVEAHAWEPGEGGWSFGDTLTRDAVVIRSRASGTWVERCLACAAGLERSDEPADAVRLGRLLRDAGQLDEAVPPIARGLAWLVRTENYLEAERVAVLFLDVVERLGPDPREARLVEPLGHVVTAFHHLGWNEDIGRLGRRWLELEGVADGTEPLSVHAWRAVCERERARGNVTGAIEAAERLVEAHRRHGGLPEGQPEFILGRCLQNDPATYDRAIALFEHAISVMSPSWQAASWYYIHMIREAQGLDPESLHALRSGEAVLDASVWPQIHALLRAEIAQYAADHGDKEGAIEGWTNAVEVLARYGYVSESFCRLNLAAELLDAGRVDEAVRQTHRARRELIRLGRVVGEVCADSVLMHAAARRGALVEVVERLEAIEARLGAIEISEPGVCLQLEGTAAAVAQRQPELARRALQLAAQHWGALARPDEQARVREWLERL